MTSIPTVTLLNVPLDAVTMRDALEHISASIARSEGGWVVTPNLDILRRLAREREYADLCAGSTLRVADGMPLIWASRLQRTPLPERVAGSDMIWSLSALAAERGHRVYFLGGNPGAADDAAAQLKAKYASLIVAGTHCPPFGFESNDAAMREIEGRLREADADIVYVALGSPKQEKLIRALRPMFPRAWFLGIGISFSFVSGEVKRAPSWMRRVGLEWMHRLVQEPRRLFKRYIVHGVPFAVYLLIVSAWRGLFSRPSRSEFPPPRTR